MARSTKAGGKKSGATAKTGPRRPAKGGKLAKAKRSLSPASRKRPTASEIELKEAREREAATAEILKVIANSPSDLDHIFEAIAESSNKLVRGLSTAVYRLQGDVLHLSAFTRRNKIADAALVKLFPRPISELPWQQRAAREGRPVQVLDAKTEFGDDPRLTELAQKRGFRSVILVPLLRKSACIGVITATRKEAGSFSDDIVRLLQTFADKAVIAIENARLFNETNEALERQTATSEILKVIASSPSDVQPVFDAIADSACRVVGGFSAVVTRVVGKEIHLAAFTTGSDAGRKALTQMYPQPISSSLAAAQVVRTGRIFMQADTESDPGVTKELARARGFRSLLSVPMLRDGNAIGTINVTRAEPGGFDENAISLMRTFADQAVIAIENARLFNEVQAKTHDLEETLQQQTATGEVLRVIASSPTELDPALQAICESACKFCNAYDAGLLLKVGSDLHFSAHYGPIRTGREPRPINRGWVVGRSVIDKVPVQVPDFDAPEAAEFPEGQRQSREQGHRCTLSVPLLKEGEAIGAIALRRLEPVAFSEKQIALLQTFANQAVIAIANARLFNETQEALEHQTATSEVLETIGSSMADTQPVFERILDSVQRLFEVRQCSVILARDQMLHLVAARGVNIEGTERLFPAPMADTQGREVISRAQQTYVPTSARGSSLMRRVAEVMGDYSVVMTPLIWEGQGIGMISAARAPNATFSDKELALLRTFADQAVIAIENARLFNETKEALERQTATADILKVIASSPSDVQPVFEAIAASANRLIGGSSTAVYRFVDGVAHLMAFTPTNPIADQVLRNTFPRPIGDLPQFDLSRRGETWQISDVRDTLEPEIKRVALARGWNSVLGAPLVHDGLPIGLITVTRAAIGSFADDHVQLLQTFADQAVIAIENARLFDEVQAKTRDLEEALRYQTGSANILNVIASSPTDVAPVLQAIVKSACELCEAYDAVLNLKDGEELQLSAHHGPIPMNRQRWKIDRTSTSGRAMADRQPVHLRDVLSDEGLEFTTARTMSLADGTHTLLSAPLLREGEPIGAITLRRAEVHAFSDKQIALLQTFADQAVIAIENTRLFNETKEALERQTATADVLKVIASSPTNLPPVFVAIAERSNRLLGGHATAVYRFVGPHVHLEAFTPVSPEADAALKASYPRPISGESLFFEVRAGKIVQITDTESESVAEITRNTARVRGWRSIVFAPLLGDAGIIGAISVTRKEPGGFAAHHVNLLRTFADQAVIAIKNVELFEEVQARTRDLQESLQQQIATADVLKVISRSTFDLTGVMNALTSSAAELCGANTSSLHLREDDVLMVKGMFAADEDQKTFLRENPISIAEESYSGRAVLSGTVINIGDVENDQTSTVLRRFSGFLGYRALLLVPLMREGRAVGLFSLSRMRVGAFSQREVELVQTFSDQAVIAIENTRLFNETKEALARQIATADVLKVIASSPSDLQPVFNCIAERSKTLIGAHSTTVVRYTGGMIHLAGYTSISPEADAALRALFPMRPDFDEGQFGLILKGEIAQIEDTEAGPENTILRDTARSRGWRSRLMVPLKDEVGVIGWISVTRKEAGAFAEKDVELLQTFADQAVIAISNVELFQEVQQRTRELSQSLDDLRFAQDRLVQTEKLASLGQLTAGIAHEIKNPLNFVNNFSQLSAELIDEMSEVFENPALDEAGRRKELDEIRELLKGNLEKVVQHGKRADSIVKNMLLHSREGSGELRAADINGLVEESLNLAYHGARAEKSGFNITLQREFDAGAGSAELYPQEITRALLNLISNGFYAAAKRKTENGEAGFEPTLSATTRNIGTAVEIRIRDNGTGIPPEVKDKIFNPFFTTKPAGEGTGLGLSMTHDIIVKQHGGTIKVDTQPGEYTEFIVTLPRATSAQASQRSMT